MMRSGSRWLVMIVTALALTSTVFAHMKLARTLPAADSTITSAPAQVQAWFTQAPDPKVSRLSLEGPSGPVTLGEVRAAADKSISAPIQGALADGAYTVSWQAAGDDGHIQKGAFTFTVRHTR